MPPIESITFNTDERLPAPHLVMRIYVPSGTCFSQARRLVERLQPVWPDHHIHVVDSGHGPRRIL